MTNKEEAQKMFDTLMNFGMANPTLPQEIMEAIDAVANYCGDIAKGREYKPGKSQERKDN